MKKGTPKDLKSNPSAGTVRIRFIGYNLSPCGAPPFIHGAKVLVFELKPIPFNLFYFASRKALPDRFGLCPHKMRTVLSIKQKEPFLLCGV